jgi:hypothetical protein
LRAGSRRLGGFQICYEAGANWARWAIESVLDVGICSICLHSASKVMCAQHGDKGQHPRTPEAPTVRPRLKGNLCWLITGNDGLARGCSSAAASLLSLFGRIRRATDQNHHRISTCRAPYIVSSVFRPYTLEVYLFEQRKPSWFDQRAVFGGLLGVSLCRAGDGFYHSSKHLPITE